MKLLPHPVLYDAKTAVVQSSASGKTSVLPQLNGVSDGRVQLSPPVPVKVNGRGVVQNLGSNKTNPNSAEEKDFKINSENQKTKIQSGNFPHPVMVTK